MKCQSCGHEVLEPVISEYCTNCGKSIGISKENATLISASAIQQSADPLFTVRELISAFFPVVASVIPVAVLSYFAAGIAVALGLTFLDLILAIGIYSRASTFQFFNDKLQIFGGARLRKEIRYSQIRQISPFTTHRQGERYEGKFLITFGQGTPEVEIPSNPSNSELKIDLFSWLSQKVNTLGKANSSG
ncbi:MAG: hypothetical protein ACHQ1H_01860 [Nitrososphaerales archaeon]